MGKKSRNDRDDRPARRKRGKSGGQMWLLVLLLGLGLVAAVGGIVWVSSLRKSDKEREKAENTSQKVILQYAPDNPIVMRSAAVAKLFADQHYKPFRAKHRASFEWQPIYPNLQREKLERYTAFDSRKGSTTILTLVEPMTEARVRQINTSNQIANSWSEEKIGKLTLHVHTSSFQVFTDGNKGDGGRDPTCFFMPDDRTIVFGTAEDLRPVLQREGKPPEVSPEFAAAYEAIDFEKPIVTALGRVQSSSDLNEDKPCSVDLKFYPKSNNVVIGKAVQTEFGPEVVTTTTYFCKDEPGAQSLKTQLEENRERRLKPLGADAQELFKNQSITVNGSIVTLRTSQRATDILAWGDRNRTLVIGN